MSLRLLAITTFALGCTPSPSMQGEPTLELRTSPGTTLDTVKGVLTLSASATSAQGTVGSGTVRFFSDIGALSAAEATIDEFGKAEVTFSCIAGMHQYCDMQEAAEVTARWSPPGKTVTVTRRVPLTRPAATGFAGDGGSGTPCESPNDCQQGLTCFENTCVGAGQLRISLSWTAQSDFDLHVITPSMKEIFYANRRADGAELDVDACVGTSTCRRTNVENVFFRSAPPPGTYSIYVRNFNGRFAGAFRLVVSGGGLPNEEFTGNLPANAGADSMRFTIMR